MGVAMKGLKTGQGQGWKLGTFTLCAISVHWWNMMLLKVDTVGASVALFLLQG